MKTIIRYALLRWRGQIVGWGVALAALALLVGSLYDTAVQMRKAEQLLKSLPPELAVSLAVLIASSVRLGFSTRAFSQ
jgi:hypothetical protein